MSEVDYVEVENKMLVNWDDALEKQRELEPHDRMDRMGIDFRDAMKEQYGHFQGVIDETAKMLNERMTKMNSAQSRDLSKQETAILEIKRRIEAAEQQLKIIPQVVEGKLTLASLISPTKQQAFWEGQTQLGEKLQKADTTVESQKILMGAAKGVAELLDKKGKAEDMVFMSKKKVWAGSAGIAVASSAATFATMYLVARKRMKSAENQNASAPVEVAAS